MHISAVLESVVIVGDVTKRSKLLGTPDYAMWSIKVRILLQGKKVCSIVDPQETNSNEVVDSRASSAKTNKSANITIFIGENDPPPINTQYHDDGNPSNSTTSHTYFPTYEI